MAWDWFDVVDDESLSIGQAQSSICCEHGIVRTFVGCSLLVLFKSKTVFVPTASSVHSVFVSSDGHSLILLKFVVLQKSVLGHTERVKISYFLVRSAIDHVWIQ